MSPLLIALALFLQPNEAAPSKDGVQPKPAGDVGVPHFEELVGLALQHRPEFTMGRMLVRAAVGDAIQAGLYPNPFLAYVADEIGAEGGAGQQGLEIAQTVVTAGKLTLARRAGLERARLREAELDQLRWTVSREVGTALVAYLQALADQMLLADLVRIAESQMRAVQALLDEGAATRMDLLQAQIEYRRALAELEAARVRAAQAREALAASIGVPSSQLPPPEEMDYSLSVPEYGVEQLRNLILSQLPALKLADIAVDIARAFYRLELARFWPDLVVSGGAGYDDSSSDAIASAGLGFELPIFNRNQGAIAASRARLAAAENLRRTFDLLARRAFSQQWAQYAAAREQIRRYETQVIPNAEENLALVREAYERGEVDYLSLLVAQRTLFDVRRELLQFKAQALQALIQLRYLDVTVLNADPMMQ